jgi:hypothetical protein
MKIEPLNIERLLSGYKLTRRGDFNLVLEWGLSKLRGIQLFCLASIVYGFITLDANSAIILSFVVIFFISTLQIIAAFSHPIFVDIKKGSITLKYLRIYGGKKVLVYDISMIKGFYPRPFPQYRGRGYFISVRLILMTGKSFKIFIGPTGEESFAKTGSEIVAKLFSDLLGTQIVSQE